MIPLAVPNLAGNEARYLQECIDSTFVSSVGPFVDRLEEQVAAAAGTTGAVAVASGTAGLHLALRTVGVGPGDLVVLPSLTFVASANAISYCGATPWLFDADPGSLTLDVAQVAAALADEVDATGDGPVHRATGRRVAAMLAVHTLGHPADIDPLVELGGELDVPVVADAAAALGATYRQRPVGRTGAAVSVFSFNGNKTITSGGGGALVADDPALLDRARHLSTTARTGRGYDHDEVGYNYRMTNLQAAVGCAQMEQLEDFVAAKRRIQAAYAERLGDLPGVRPLPEAPWAHSACWLAGMVVDGRAPDELDALRERLRAREVDARPFWRPMHQQAPYRDAPRAAQDVTEAVWPRVLTLPCSTGLTDAELDHVVTAVRAEVASVEGRA